MSEAEIAAQLLDYVRSWIVEQDIRCAETIYQTDRVIENAYGFIEGLCDIVGYPE